MSSPKKLAQEPECNPVGQRNPPTSSSSEEVVKVAGDSETAWVEVVSKTLHSPSKQIDEQNMGEGGKKGRYPREQCIVILKAPESQSEVPEQRMEDDRSFLQRCISKLFEVGEPGLQVVSAYRLGKKKADWSSNPRPLKVVLESSSECERVFRRTYKLRGEPYYLVRDLCPEDRIKMKEAVAELKQRKQAGETNLKIVDFQVVQGKPKARWKPVLLQPSNQI